MMRPALLCLAAALLSPTLLEGQGLTLRLAPEGSAVRWAEEVGLEDATFLGGGLSLGFGRYVTLRGAYRTAGIVGTAFGDSGFLANDGATLAENRVDASLFETSVLFRLGARRFAPVLAAGGGVLDLAPEGRDQARQIFVGYGGGLDLRLTPWLDGQILVEDVRLRLDRSLLTRSGARPADDVERGTTRGGLGLTASFGVRAGDARSSGRADDVDRGFAGLLEGNAESVLVPVETLVGVVRFDDALGLRDQATVGVRTGLDFGEYFGVRAQYWRGVTDAFDAWRGVTGWTGEVQFNVGRVTGASPHLVLGFGQTRFDEDVLTEEGVQLDDQNALVVGAGVGIPLGDRARFTVTARDYVTTAGSLEQISSTADLRHSFGVSGGFSVLLVGRRALPRARADLAPTPRDSTDYRSDQVVSIPLPREGELYLRYGPGGRTLPGLDSATVSAALTEELTRLLEGGQVALSDSARSALEARVLERVRALALPSGADSAAGAPRPGAGAPAGGQVDPSLDALRRQVEELTRLVREGMLLQAAGGTTVPGGTTVNLVAEGRAEPAATAQAEPLLRALEGGLGRSSLDEANGGLALSADAYLSPLRGDERLIPFTSLELAHVGVRTTDRGTAARGSVTTVGVHFGVVASLPHVGPLWPTFGILVAAAQGRTGADRPADAAVMDRLYGGLSLGPGIVLGAGYRRTPDSRTLVTGAMRKVWAGRSSRWSVEAGMRLVFPPRSGTAVGPFSLRAAEPAPGAPAIASAEPAADTLGPPPSRDPGTPAASDTLAARLLARLEALEAQVRAVSSEREEALAEARASRARADSLASLAEAEVQADERERRAAAEARSALVAGLEGMARGSTLIASVQETGEGVRVTLGGDLFPAGSTDVRAAAHGEIRSLGAILASGPVASLTVDGHTDASGTEEANLAISRLRADAVRRALVAGGVPPERITVVGSGEASPIADNDTREGRARNRRVEVLVRFAPAGG